MQNDRPRLINTYTEQTLKISKWGDGWDCWVLTMCWNFYLWSWCHHCHPGTTINFESLPYACVDPYRSAFHSALHCCLHSEILKMYLWVLYCDCHRSWELGVRGSKYPMCSNLALMHDNLAGSVTETQNQTRFCNLRVQTAVQSTVSTSKS